MKLENAPFVPLNDLSLTALQLLMYEEPGPIISKEAAKI